MGKQLARAGMLAAALMATVVAVVGVGAARADDVDLPPSGCNGALGCTYREGTAGALTILMRMQCGASCAGAEYWVRDTASGQVVLVPTRSGHPVLGVEGTAPWDASAHPVLRVVAEVTAANCGGPDCSPGLADTRYYWQDGQYVPTPTIYRLVPHNANPTDWLEAEGYAIVP